VSRRPGLYISCDVEADGPMQADVFANLMGWNGATE
jgi:hypothetical protein